MTYTAPEPAKVHWHLMFEGNDASRISHHTVELPAYFASKADAEKALAACSAPAEMIEQPDILRSGGTRYFAVAGDRAKGWRRYMTTWCVERHA